MVTAAINLLHGTKAGRAGEAGHEDYRPDIDGLRAVAVLAVLLFHAFPGRLPCGFLGVDVFFVISGFLISRIIFSRLEERRFSFADFYARRVKRIFPALIVVLLGTLIAGWFMLLPGEYEQLGKHVASGAAFGSNLVLWSEAGYFDGDSALKPLLHLWSLGIEEQFYIVWPALLVFIWNWRRWVLAVIAAIITTSFTLALLAGGRDSVAAFYSPLTRFWELALGAGLAYLMLGRPQSLPLFSPALRNVCSLAGGLAIAIAILALDASAHYPGWRSLFPTLGAVLLIGAGRGAWLNRTLLSHPAMVAVGLISYPLYLVHWPLLSFARIVEGAMPSMQVRLALCAASFVIAWGIYRLVEKPLRFGRFSSRPVFGLTGVAVVTALVGLACYVQNGFGAARGPWSVLNIADSHRSADYYMAAYVNANAGLFVPKFRPTQDFYHLTQRGSGGLDIVVLGDSHANRLYQGLVATTDYSIANFGRGTCLPLFGYEAIEVGKKEVLGASPTMGNLIERTIELRPKVVVLTAIFSLAYDGRLIMRGTEPVPALMRKTLVRLAAEVPRVIIAFACPELPSLPSHWLARPFNRQRRYQPDHFSFPRQDFDKTLALCEKDFRKAAEGLSNVYFFNPAVALCDESRCFVAKENKMLYDDRSHLSRYGAILVAEAMRPLVDAAVDGSIPPARNL